MMMTTPDPERPIEVRLVTNVDRYVAALVEAERQAAILRLLGSDPMGGSVA